MRTRPWFPPYVVCLLSATLTPVIPRWGPSGFWNTFDLPDFLMNTAMLVPLGMAVGRRRAIVLAAVVLVCALGVEWLQRWLYRSPSLFDVAANGLGAFCGAWWASRLLPLVPTWISRRLGGVLLVLSALTFVATVASRHSAPANDFRNWESMPLAIGNELDGGRPWRGRIEAFAVHDRLPEPLERGFAEVRAEPLPWLEGGPLLWMRFQGEPRARLDGPTGPKVIALPPLPASFQLEGGGLLASGGDPWVFPDAVAQHLVEHLRGVRTLCVTVALQPDRHQEGNQGRILTLSRDAEERCFTVGQKSGALVWRVRTPATGQNGRAPQVVTADPVLEGRPVTLWGTFDGMWTRVFVDGEEQGAVCLPAEQGVGLTGRGLVPALCVLLGLAGLGLASWGRTPRTRGLACVAGVALSAGASVAAGVLEVMPHREIHLAIGIIGGIACVPWARRIGPATPPSISGLRSPRHAGTILVLLLLPATGTAQVPQAGFLHDDASDGRGAVFRSFGGRPAAVMGRGLVRVLAGDTVVGIRIEGPHALAPEAGKEPMALRVNRIRGRDGRGETPASCASVMYRGTTPGVDLEYRYVEGGLESIWRVAPGASPHAIRWRYEGVQPRLEEDGSLALCGGSAVLMVEAPPVAWQHRPDGTVPVEVRFRLDDDGSLGFETGAYDPSLPLVIDPILRFSTLFGGGRGGGGFDQYGIGTERIMACAVGPDGDLYVAGYAHSWERRPGPLPLQAAPGTRPFQEAYGGEIGDAFVARIDARIVPPRLIWVTYLGGGRGWSYGDPIPIAGTQPPYPLPGPLVAGTDTALDLAVDQDGEVVVVGRTMSDDFPGTGIAGRRPAATLAAYPPFRASHADHLLPALPGAATYDGFVIRLTRDGDGLVFGTYLGGKGYDEAAGVVLDDEGRAYVLLTTTMGPELPVVGARVPARHRPAGSIDACVLILDRVGRYLGGTYIGGEDADWGMGIDRGPDGRIHVVGATRSPATGDRGLGIGTARGARAPASATDHPIVGAPIDGTSMLQFGYQGLGRSFLTILEPGLDAVSYATLIAPCTGGVARDEGAIDVCVDEGGDVYVCGAGRGRDGRLDGWVARIRPEGGGPSDLVAKVPLRGSRDDLPFRIALGWDRVYVVGSTFSPDGPVLAPLTRRTLARPCPFVTCAAPRFTPAVPPASLDGATLGGDRDGFLWGLDRDLSPVFWTYFGGRTAEGLYGLAAQGRVVYAGGASHVVPLRGLLATQDPPTHWPLCEGSLLNADAFDGGGYNGGQPACGGSADALLLSVYDDT